MPELRARAQFLPLMALLFTWLFLTPMSTVPFQGEKALSLLAFGVLGMGVIGEAGWSRSLLRSPMTWGGVGVALLSTLGGVAPHVALWGNDDRYMGVLVWGAAAVLGYVWWRGRGDAWWLGQVLGLAWGISAGVLVWARLWPPPPMSPLGPLAAALAAGGTLGNTSFLGVASAASALYFAGMAGLARKAGRRGWVWWGLAAGGGLEAVLIGSRAAVIGLGVGALVLGHVTLMGSERWPYPLRRRLVGLGWLLGMGLPLAGIVWALSHPHGLLWRWLYRNGTLQQRLLVWRAMGTLFQRSPVHVLTGFGADTLGYVFPRVYPPALIAYEPDGRAHVFDRAHNIVLDVVYQFGVGGALFVLGLLLLVGYGIRRGRKHTCPAATGALAAWVALLAMWGLHFPTPTSLLLFALFLGTSVLPCKNRPTPLSPSLWTGWALALTSAWMLPYGGTWARGPLLVLAAGLLGVQRGWRGTRVWSVFLPALAVATVGAVSPATWPFLIPLALFLGTWIAFGWGWRLRKVGLWGGLLLLLLYTVVRPLVADGWHQTARVWGTDSATASLGWMYGERAWRWDGRERIALTMASLASFVTPSPEEQVRLAHLWLERAPRPHGPAWWFVYLQVTDRALQEGLISRDTWRSRYCEALEYFPGNLEWRAKVEATALPCSR